MSTCATWDVLQIARDARLSGLPVVEAELLAEAAPDQPVSYGVFKVDE